MPETREEFIDGYMNRSDLPTEYRTEDGYYIPTYQRHYALPCACDDEDCKGWAMVGEDLVDSHMKLYAPTEGSE